MSIILRSATLEDYNQLRVIYEELDELHRYEHPDLFQKPDGNARPVEYIKDLVLSKNKALIVAESDEVIIGFAECFVVSSGFFPVFKQRKWVHLDNIAIKREYQNKGIGKLLLNEIKLWAKTRNIRRVELMVYKFNKQAKHFYQNTGFNELTTTMYMDL